MSFMDNLLSRFRKIFVNSITAFFLLLITIGVFSSIASLFDSDEIETKDKILYLEPKGVIVDKAITRDDPFEDFELFGGSTNQIELDDILKNTTSGGVTINDVVFHVAQDNAPFGGVGPSGTGSYHGIEGFKNFSHAKTIYTQTKFDGLINIFRPPYGTKAKKALKMQIRP